jgi:hypothetical protein
VPVRAQAEPTPLSYSMRRACVEEMVAARLAGMMAAKNGETAKAVAARNSASGSQMETP